MTSSEANPARDDTPLSAANATSPRANRGWGRWGLLLVVLAAAYVAFVVIRDRSFEGQGTEHPAVGGRLEFLSLRRVDDDRFVSLSQLAGKVALVNFWGTWCPPCREELPHLAALAETYANRDDFRLLAVACPQEPDEASSALLADAREFLADHELALPAYVDVAGQTQSAADLAIGLDGYPTTIALARDGRIRGVWVGYRRGYEGQMAELVAELLEEPVEVELPEITITGQEMIVPIEDDEPPP